MGKLLFWLVVILLAWVIWAVLRSMQRRQDLADAARLGKPGRGSRSAAQRIVACAHCGLHLPIGDAIRGRRDEDARYCCIEHRDADRG